MVCFLWDNHVTFTAWTRPAFDYEIIASIGLENRN
jgi:hypothetical protein